MINIVFSSNSIKINGHANYQSKGNDIICASISAIVQSSLNWFKEEDIKFNISSGNYYLEVCNLSSDNCYKLELLKIQLISIASSYSKYIKIKENKNEQQ